MIIGVTSSLSGVLGMTYLQLVEELWSQCRKNGAAPTAVHDQTGERADFVRWIARAWVTIQTMRQDWKWMRKSTTFVTVNGQHEYTPVQCGILAGGFGKWIPESFRVYPTAVGPTGEIELHWEPDYDEWRRTYLYSGNRDVRSQPIVAAPVPQTQGLALGPIPSGIWTITADYYKAPVLLSSANEIPDLPPNHDPMMIVHKALCTYAVSHARPEVYAESKEQLQLMLQRLLSDQAPRMTVGGTLGR